MTYTPIRWQQRFQNFEKAYNRLIKAIDRYNSTPEDELILEGLVQTYEFTYELSLNTLKDYLTEEGSTVLTGTKSVVKEALQQGIIKEGHLWMSAIDDRNLTSHTYDEKTAQIVVHKVCEDYFYLIKDLYEFFKKEINNGQ